MTKLKLVVSNPLHEQVLWVDARRYSLVINHIEKYRNINELGEILLKFIIDTIAVADKYAHIALNKIPTRPPRYNVKKSSNPDTPLSPEVAAILHKAKFGIDALYAYVEEGNMKEPRWADTLNNTIHLWLDYLEKNPVINQPDPYLPLVG